jgi:hypothetical protein
LSLIKPYILFMKTYTALFLFLVSINLFGQKTEDEKNLSPSQRAEHIVGEIYERTYLSVARKDSLIEIYTSYYQNKQAYRANGNEKLEKAIEKTKENKIKNLLNAEQYQAYEGLMAEEQEKRAKQEDKKKVPGMMNNTGGTGGRSTTKW